MNSPPSVPQAQEYTNEGILLSPLPPLVHPCHSIVPQGWTDPVHNTLTLNSHLQRRFMKKSFSSWSGLYVSMRCISFLTPRSSVSCSYRSWPPSLGHCRSRKSALFSAKTDLLIITAANKLLPKVLSLCCVLHKYDINFQESLAEGWAQK